MGCSFRASVLALFFACFSRCCGLESVDTRQPIVLLSPARASSDQRYQDDWFGYAAIAHQLEADLNAPDVQLQEALQNTRIIVSAPKGRYPGGLTNLPIDVTGGQICAEAYPSADLTSLDNDTLLDCYLQTGLVFSCPLLPPGDCQPLLGNGNYTRPDGLLFDRRGNDEELNTNNGMYEIMEDKDKQLMGATLTSSGDYFMACAPMWTFATPMSTTNKKNEQRGRCVYSNRTLTDFQILKPCTSGSSTNQDGGGFCTSGWGAWIASNIGGEQIIGVGTPGREYSVGGVYYYTNLNDTTINADEGAKDPTYSPDEGPPDQNTENEQFVYNGWFLTSGNFFGSEEFLVSSPRFTQTSLKGRISLITDFDSLPNVIFEGEEFGDYFGYSIATADLNGDGWTDMVVGAPVYSKTTQPEIGRIVIFVNEEGSQLVKNATITGNTAFGRFGLSLATLGDLNNDGYDDFAVSAPFENNGTVYIYYGRDADTIVNPMPQQVITANEMVSRVSNLTSLSTFGFSLQGSIDVDNNRYQDLVIGAHESQAVFVLRSRPVANVDLSINASVERVPITTKLCTVSGSPTACFNVMVCAYYSGKGLTSFIVDYEVTEIFSGSSRIYFTPGDATSSTVSRKLNFTNPGEAGGDCDSFTAYVADTAISTTDNVRLRVSLVPFDLPDEVVDANLVPADFSSQPILEFESETLELPLAVGCGDDEICHSDLTLEFLNVTYLAFSGEQYPDQSQLVAGAISRMEIYFNYSNQRENAFNISLDFTLPSLFFEHINVYPQTLFIGCSNVSDNETHTNFTCTGFQSPLFKGENVTIWFRWAVTDNLRGDEGAIHTFFSFMIEQGPKNVENESLLGDNVASVPIIVAAFSNYSLESAFVPSKISYQVSETPPNVSVVSDLGDKFTAGFTLNNEGPSPLYNATITIYLPLRSAVTGSNYFLYPVNIDDETTSSISCNKTNLPTSIPEASGSRRRRRRRTVALVSSSSPKLGRRQSSNEQLSCADSSQRASCLQVVCQVTNFAKGSATIAITGYVDERFFYDQSMNYTLTAYGKIDVHDSFLELSSSQTTTSASLLLTMLAMAVEDPTIPLWVYYVPAIAAVIIIAILAVILYLFGFFRRKRKRPEADDGTGAEPADAPPAKKESPPPDKKETPPPESQEGGLENPEKEKGES